MIGVYKEQFPEWQKEYQDDYDITDGDSDKNALDDNTPEEVKNLVQFLRNHEKLNLKQKNEIIWYHNALMKDKGKYGGQMWKYLQNLNKEEILNT